MSGDEETRAWYREYYASRGSARNDILQNSGVLFQNLAFERSVVEAMRSLPVDRNWQILDVGCGAGGSLNQFVALGFPPRVLHGIDIMPERIAEGRALHPNFDFTSGDASSMNWPSASFDLVLESTMFIQLTGEELARNVAAEMIRVVKPGGRIMLIDWRYSLGHPEYCAVSRTRIRKLFEVGSSTRIEAFVRGALVPPIGRALSSYLPSLYFVIQRAFPFLVGQVTTVLQRCANPLEPTPSGA